MEEDEVRSKPQEEQIVKMFMNDTFVKSFYQMYDSVMDKKILESAKDGDGDKALEYARASENLRTFVNSITGDLVKENKQKEKDNKE